MNAGEFRAASIRHVLAREWPPKSSVAIRSALSVAVALVGFTAAVVQLSVAALGLGALALVVGVGFWPREADYDAWTSPSRRRRPVADRHDSLRGAASIRTSADVADDLRSARTARRAVKLTTYDGQRFGYVGVDEVDPDGTWVVLATPVRFGDVTTQRCVEIENIATVSITRIAWA